MSFGTRISFGRFCKILQIGRFCIIKASGKEYNSFEEISTGPDSKVWFITPDGKTHDDIVIETEEYYYHLMAEGHKEAYKRALEGCGG